MKFSKTLAGQFMPKTNYLYTYFEPLNQNKTRFKQGVKLKIVKSANPNF